MYLVFGLDRKSHLKMSLWAFNGNFVHYLSRFEEEKETIFTTQQQICRLEHNESIFAAQVMLLSVLFCLTNSSV